MKRLSLLLTVVMMVNALSYTSFAEDDKKFDDVPVGHWSESYIQDLRALGVTDGMGNNQYGYGLTMTREQFVTFLFNLNGWEEIIPESNSFSDVPTSRWSYPKIETALNKGIIQKDGGVFRPEDLITREEIGIMIINSLGYAWLAEQRNDINSPFDDVTQNIGYISMLKDFGIVNGKSERIFDPKGFAKREEAAAILMRMYDIMSGKIDETNVFYSQGSYDNIDLMTSFDRVSFNWASLRFDKEGQVYVDTDFPLDYNLATDPALKDGMGLELSIRSELTSEDNIYGSVLKKSLANEENIDHLVKDIIGVMDDYSFFTGVVIDFEGLQSTQKKNFLIFLEELKIELGDLDKSLTVMVQPSENFGGYDYAGIVNLADQMIVMAHDYAPVSISDDQRLQTINRNTPVAPIEKVYEALKDIIDDIKSVDGISQKQVKEAISRISLQISFDSVQWQTDSDGVITTYKPYKPTYDKIFSRLMKEDTSIGYGSRSRSPYATYYDANLGIDNILWYEDTRSIEEKLDLAGMFGIRDISVWFLGGIPDYQDGDKVNLDVMRLFK